MAIPFWIVTVPEEWFELLFMPDKNGNVLFGVAKEAENLNGKDCAYMTQGYSLWILEQFFKNSPEMHQKTGLTMQDIEHAVEILDGRQVRH